MDAALTQRIAEILALFIVPLLILACCLLYNVYVVLRNIEADVFALRTGTKLPREDNEPNFRQIMGLTAILMGLGFGLYWLVGSAVALWTRK
jgi:hypothetical protein